MRQGSRVAHHSLFILLWGITTLLGSAFAATTTLHPSGLLATRGSHSSQALSVLRVKDQAGNDDNWNAYLEFYPQSTGYIGVFSFTLPGGIKAADVMALSIETNYRGADKAMQRWQWQMRDFCKNTWVTWGDNSNAKSWIWSPLRFGAIGNASCYAASNGELKMRYLTNSGVDNSNLDFLTLEVVTAPPVTAQTEILIPLYSYPNWYDATNYIWDDIAAVGGRTRITAIINPNNGPNGCPNSDYQRGISDLRGGGVIPVGYVYTGYGTRDISAVKADVDQYRLCFDVDGIFFDEAANTSDHLPYYQELYRYVKAQPKFKTVIINPGTPTLETYLDGTSDTVVMFEGDPTAWANYTPAPYSAKYPARRFAALIHGVPNADAMRAYVDLAIRRNIGAVHLTNDTMPNPWDSLPGMWPAEVDYLTARNTVWRPRPGTRWQWQLSGTVDTSLNVQMYDVDLFDTPQSVIDRLHADGRIVICYFSAGSWENWREDATQFPASVLGNPLDGWPGERWLDIRRLDLIGPLIKARLDVAVRKKCDGVEPDNVDGYTNGTGFPLTHQHQLTYNRFLAGEAHRRHLSIGLKNDLDQVKDLVADFDWALNEQCFYYKECDQLTPFIAAGKAVFGVEYVEQTPSAASFCSEANARQFDWLHKRLSLDAWRTSCR